MPSPTPASLPLASPENPLSPETLETPNPAPLKPKVEAGVKKPTDSSKVTPPPSVKADFASDYFKVLGLQVCPKCGNKKQTDGCSNVICGVGESNCPMVEESKK